MELQYIRGRIIDKSASKFMQAQPIQSSVEFLIKEKSIAKKIFRQT